MLFLLGIFSSGSSMSGIEVKNYFPSFSACVILNYAKNNPQKLFANFSNFFAIFFRICSPGSWMSAIRVQNFFISFSSDLILSHPVLAKNNAGNFFFNILNFFPIFFRNFLPRVEYERNSGLKFFNLFLGLSSAISSRFGSN